MDFLIEKYRKGMESKTCLSVLLEWRICVIKLNHCGPFFRLLAEYEAYEPRSCFCALILFYVCIQGVGENACAKKSHEKYLIALKGSGLAFPEDKIACGIQEQGAGTSTLSVQGLCRKIFQKKT